jgi:uncharacterized protein (TIGR00369 family)
MLERIAKWMAEGGEMPVCRLVGMQVDQVEAGKAVCSMVAEARHHNPFGTVHGGVLCDLSDLAMGMAFMATLNEGEALATVELKINYLRPAKTGRLVAKAHVVHRGRQTGLVECAVENEEGKLVAKAASTCMVVRDERAEVWAAR